MGRRKSFSFFDTGKTFFVFIKKLFLKITREFTYSIGHIGMGIALLCIVVSLWMVWIFEPYGDMKSGIFCKFFGITGYLTLAMLTFIIAMILFSKKKEHIKILFRIRIHDGYIFFFLFFFMFLFHVNTLFIVKGIAWVYTEVIPWNGVVLAVIGDILGIASSFSILFSKHSIAIFTEEEAWNREKTVPSNSSNMKLPF